MRRFSGMLCNAGFFCGFERLVGGACGVFVWGLAAGCGAIFRVPGGGGGAFFCVSWRACGVFFVDWWGRSAGCAAFF